MLFPDFIKHLTIFSIILTSILPLNAQNVGGYQGKRFLLEYNFQPSLTGFSNGGLNAIHNIQIGFVGTKRFVFGAAYEFFNTNIKDNESITVKGTAAGVNIDWFIKNNRAPVGPYIHFEIRLMNAENSIGQDISQQIYGGGFGMRRIIKDRFIINFGSALSWVSRQNNMSGLVQINEAIGEPDLQRLFLYRFNLGIGVLLF